MIWCSRRLKPPRKRTSCGSRAVAHDARTGHRCSAIVWHTCPTSSPKAKAYVRWTGQAAYASLQTGCCGAAARNRRCCCRDGDPAANGVIPPDTTCWKGARADSATSHHTARVGAWSWISVLPGCTRTTVAYRSKRAICETRYEHLVRKNSPRQAGI